MLSLGTTTTTQAALAGAGYRVRVEGWASPPGQDQGAVSQDAHLSQLLESLLGIFLEEKKVRSRDLGKSRDLQCGNPTAELGRERALSVKPQDTSSVPSMDKKLAVVPRSQ